MSTTQKPKAEKAPAKPRKTAAKSPAVKTATAKTTAQTPVAKSKVAAPPVAVPTHQEIALLAEKYWAERGWQDGAAEQDWLRAEQELMKLAS